MTDLDWLAASGEVPTLATIWATVDLERAIATAGASVVGTPLEDPFLGARVVVVEPAEGGRIALAEPSTEGRLAATLARHDEGVVGRYVEVSTGQAELRRRAASAGVAISPAADGPFGRSVLVLGAPTGPHVILVLGAALPSSR